MMRSFIFLIGILSSCSVYSNQVPLHVTGVILPDPAASYTAQKALELYLESEGKQLPIPRKVKAPVNWIIAEINNPDTENEWVINLSSALINNVDLYVFENGQLREHRRTGRAINKTPFLFTTHYGYIFEIIIPQHKQQHLLIRTETQFYYNIGAWAQPAEEFWQYSNTNTIIMVLATGVIAGLLLYNLFLAIRIKDTNYLWYSLHALGFLLYFINTHSYYSGITPYLTNLLGWPNLFDNNSKVIYLINSFLIMQVQFFGALFCYRFLNIAKISPLLKRLFQLYLSVVILEIFLFFVLPLIDFALFNGIWTLVQVPLVLCGSLVAVIKKVPQATYLMVGWNIMLFSNGMSMLEIMGELDYSLYTALRSSVSTAAEMLIFSLALADRVRTLMQDKSIAEQASQAKSEFLAIMSHEIRTPLYGVLGTTKLLTQTPLTPQQQEYLKSIDYSGQALLTVIDEILDYSKLEADALTLEHKDFDLRSLLYSMVVLLHGRADEKGLDFACSIDDQIANRLCGDANRLRQILLNLLGNAIKFTDHGSVSLSAELIAAVDQQVTLKFSVIDTGIGIKESQKENIFTYFSQADSSITRRYGGTGMGLAIAKKLVERMNGSIDFTSEPGAGSCFFFVITLPLGDSTISPELNQQSEAIFKCLNFLVVDDLDINRTISEDLLLFEGHNVTVAENGNQALTLLSELNFDVVLMDIRMPIMDGIAVTRELRKREDNTPIIGFTASVMPDEQALCLAAGMNAVLAKPLDLSALNQILTELYSNSKFVTHSDSENNILIQHRQKLGRNKFLGLLEKYRKLSQQYLAIIENSIENGDRSTLKEHTHQLAGMAGSMGFLEVSHLANKLEKIAENNDKEALNNCLIDLQKSYLTTLKTIDSKNQIIS